MTNSHSSSKEASNGAAAASSELSLVERLRSRAWEHRHHRKYREEAAAEIERLNAALAGDATLAGMHFEGRGLDIGIRHPLVALLADAMAKMIDGNNYVEMQATHRQTGDEYMMLCQRLSRPTPHELRKRAEEALRRMTERYVSLVNSGDCGNWNPEEEADVVNARAILSLSGAAAAQEFVETPVQHDEAPSK